MSIDDIRKILSREYGIQTDEDFEEAVNASAGINIGIFTEPLEERGAGSGMEQSEAGAA